MALSVETSSRISRYLEALLPGLEKAVNNISLEEIILYKNPLVREMFADNPKEFINFFILERVERSFVTRMGHMIENLVEILVEGQGGEVLGKKKDWKPYDLKFRLSDGKEYWIEIKSILNQNNSNWGSIRALKKNANKQGKEFRLCIYYRTSLNISDEYIVVGKDFWSFVGGDADTETVLFRLMTGIGREFSFINLIQKRADVLLEEYLQYKELP